MEVRKADKACQAKPSQAKPSHRMVYHLFLFTASHPIFWTSLGCQPASVSYTDPSFSLPDKSTRWIKPIHLLHRRASQSSGPPVVQQYLGGEARLG